MKKIQLSNGQFITVDDEDFAVLNRFTFTLDSRYNTFPDACFKSENGSTYNIPITRFLFNTFHFSKTGYMPIPKDGDCLNCCKDNIEFVLNQIRRQRSAKTSRPTSSKYKGVCRANKQAKCWRGYIKKDDKQYTSYHYSENEAAAWYNSMAIELFGEYAYQNKII